MKLSFLLSGSSARGVGDPRIVDMVFNQFFCAPKTGRYTVARFLYL